MKTLYIFLSELLIKHKQITNDYTNPISKPISDIYKKVSDCSNYTNISYYKGVLKFTEKTTDYRYVVSPSKQYPNGVDVIINKKHLKSNILHVRMAYIDSCSMYIATVVINSSNDGISSYMRWLTMINTSTFNRTIEDKCPKEKTTSTTLLTKLYNHFLSLGWRIDTYTEDECIISNHNQFNFKLVKYYNEEFGAIHLFITDNNRLTAFRGMLHETDDGVLETMYTFEMNDEGAKAVKMITDSYNDKHRSVKANPTDTMVTILNQEADRINGEISLLNAHLKAINNLLQFY